MDKFYQMLIGAILVIIGFIQTFFTKDLGITVMLMVIGIYLIKAKNLDWIIKILEELN